MRRCMLAELRDQAAAHQRPVGERESGAGAAHVRPDEQEREGHDRSPRSQARVGLADHLIGHALRRTPRAEGVDHCVQQRCEQDHRDGEVRGDIGRAKSLTDDDGSEPRLHDHEHQRRDRRPEDAARLPVPSPRRDQHHADQQDDDRRRGPVRELDRRREALDAGEEPAVAVRPVFAAPEAGFGRADEPADGDEDERRHGGRDREPLEAGHVPPGDGSRQDDTGAPKRPITQLPAVAGGDTMQR